MKTSILALTLLAATTGSPALLAADAEDGRTLYRKVDPIVKTEFT